MSEEQPKRSIDERLDALTMNLELLEARSQETQKQVDETSRKVDQLVEIVNAHEQEWDRFRRAMRAGFREFFGDDDSGNGDERG